MNTQGCKNCGGSGFFGVRICQTCGGSGRMFNSKILADRNVELEYVIARTVLLLKNNVSNDIIISYLERTLGQTVESFIEGQDAEYKKIFESILLLKDDE